MKTYPITDERGQLYAFEVPLVYVSRRALAEILAGVRSVEGVRTPGGEERGDGARVLFECGGKSYLICEPFGDNSRYWIGPQADDDRCTEEEFCALESAFRSYAPAIPRKILGDLLSLNFRSLFRRE